MSILNANLAVVVIGRNEGERLGRCLQSVISAEQVPGGAEFIYVDSGSHDGSVELARGMGWQVVELTAARMTAALARNAGWQAATAEWVLFLDGDTILDPAFPAAALATAQADGDIAAVWGHRRELRPTANFYHRVLDLDWVYAPGVSEFCGGDALFRRSALEAVSGFDPQLIAGEEPEMCSRIRGLGYRIVHIDHPMTSHDLAISRWTQYWRRASRAGYAYAQMAWKTRGREVRLWSRESRANLVRATALCGIISLSLLGPAAALMSAAILTGLSLRSAARSRWKSNDRVSLLCYGVHSHLQQLPIAAGQAAFLWDRLRNRRRMLIEYK